MTLYEAPKEARTLMRSSPKRFAVPALGAVAAVVLFAVVGAAVAPAALKHGATTKPASSPKTTLITVTAGKPSELAFKLSKSSMLPVGLITFKVTDMGVAFHNFRLCAKPVASPTSVANACAGKSTPLLKHGQSATLTVRILKSGMYEFLCTVSGHAAAGMKGLLGVGVAVTASQQKAASTTGTSTTPTSGGGGGGATTPTTTTPTTTRPGSGGGGGNASGCPPGVTIPTSGAADADGDELGTEPDDNDGCV
jgi:uncharacterized cupredoxin-like copper-binding protein